MSSTLATATGADNEAVASAADREYQDDILQDVSRTFALTIPQLPGDLREVVGNAYLLCRIADTIEDDKDLSGRTKRQFAERFIDVVAGREPAAAFARDLAPRLSAHTPDAERDLVANTEAVIRITQGFNTRQGAALERCVRIMAEGMAHYQEAETLDGLDSQPDMDRYCYYVAGVVGEMLTELFCSHSDEIDARHDELMPLAVSFGQALQMTNILKDIWDDRRRGACWLPRDRFASAGVLLSEVRPGAGGPAFEQELRGLVGIAHGHLQNALRYTLLIPRHETGIRKFCLWALGMAVLTLQKINANPGFQDGRQVKISRRSVKATIFVTNIAVSSDKLLNLLFKLAAKGLPKPPAP